MYFQLGDLRFEAGLTVQGIETTSGGNISEVNTLAGRPMLQRQAGQPLLRRTITIPLFAALGHDPAGKYELLAGWRDEGRVLPLASGQGEDLGQYLIASLAETVIVAGLDGQRLQTSITVELIEYVDRSPAVSAKRQAVAAGFATDERRVIPILPTSQGITAASVTSTQARAGQGLCLDAADDVRTVVVVPSQKQSFFARAKSKVESAIRSFEGAIETIQNVATIAATAPQLLAKLETVKASAEVFSTRLDEGDLTNALIAGQIMSDSAGDITTSLRPLDLSIIARKPT